MSGAGAQVYGRPVMAGMDIAVTRVDGVVPVGEFWSRLAIGLVTMALVLATVLYGSAPPPGSTPAPALRPATDAQITGLTSVLARDWSRARAADHTWFAGCYDPGAVSPSACLSALHRQVAALQQLQRDISAQRLAGTQLGPIVDGRFLHSVAAVLAVKRTALASLTSRQVPGYEAERVGARAGPAQMALFLRSDVDPVLCIEPVSAALEKATGRGASHPLFRSYPLSNGWFPISGRGSCPAAQPTP